MNSTNKESRIIDKESRIENFYRRFFNSNTISNILSIVAIVLMYIMLFRAIIGLIFNV